VNVTLTLTAEQVEQIAGRVAELLSATKPAQAGGLVDATTVAAALGVSRDWVYDHASQLGGVKVGDGDRPRWRFNLADALAAFEPAGEPTRATPRRRRPSNGNGRHLLPVHGEAER
jgi:hypothetical protein